MTLESAIAAAAHVGSSAPTTASGIITTLYANAQNRFCETIRAVRRLIARASTTTVQGPAEELHVGRRQRHVGTGADGDAHVGPSERRRVVQAVTDEGDRPSRGPPGRDHRDLAVGEDLRGHVVDADLVGDRPRGARAVTGDDADRDAHRAQPAQGSRRPPASRRPRRRAAHAPTVAPDLERGQAATRPLVDGLVRRRRSRPTRTSDPVDGRDRTRARLGRVLARGRDRTPASQRASSTARAIGCSEPASTAAASASTASASHACARHDLGEAIRPSVIVPVLSNSTRSTALARSIDLAAAHEDAELGRAAGARHDRRGRGEAEGARARDQDDGGRVEQRLPGLASVNQSHPAKVRAASARTMGTKTEETRSASCWTDAFDPWAACERSDDLGERGVLPAAGHEHDEPAVPVDRSADHVIARRDVDRGPTRR